MTRVAIWVPEAFNSLTVTFGIPASPASCTPFRLVSDQTKSPTETGQFFGAGTLMRVAVLSANDPHGKESGTNATSMSWPGHGLCQVPETDAVMRSKMPCGLLRPIR
ncbi:hypothetical protein GCM10009768_17900 [Leucobacter iarius]|uniref:Uncharacterized protein n=1 Tax=Leucobacter iarius TaxID=333963 RepID=A0ABN2LIM2_9MICO